MSGRPNLKPAERSDDRIREAWRLHRALMLAGAADPALATDNLFLAFRAEAFERFERLMGERL